MRQSQTFKLTRTTLFQNEMDRDARALNLGATQARSGHTTDALSTLAIARQKALVSGQARLPHPSTRISQPCNDEGAE
jgi:hypothetical protein